jgi:hypothetical protein
MAPSSGLTQTQRLLRDAMHKMLPGNLYGWLRNRWRWGLPRTPAQILADDVAFTRSRARRAKVAPGAHRTVILTTYLTGIADPARHERVPPNDLARVAGWSAGILRQGLRGVVFHDQLSTDFCRMLEGECLSFVRVPTPAGLSTNDYRFGVFLDWLDSHPVLDSIFCTDLFDVRVNGNPHALVGPTHDLWVGVEDDLRIDATTSYGRYLLERIVALYGDVPSEVIDQRILNAGVWGGGYEAVTHFLRLMVDELRRLDPDGRGLNANMPAFNAVLRREFRDSKLWTQGAPLHSRFRAYEMEADVCFVHK